MKNDGEKRNQIKAKYIKVAVNPGGGFQLSHRNRGILPIDHQFLLGGGWGIPILLDSDGRVGLRYEVRSIPTTYLIDREGYV